MLFILHICWRVKSEKIQTKQFPPSTSSHTHKLLHLQGLLLLLAWQKTVDLSRQKKDLLNFTGGVEKQRIGRPSLLQLLLSLSLGCLCFSHFYFPATHIFVRCTRLVDHIWTHLLCFSRLSLSVIFRTFSKPGDSLILWHLTLMCKIRL